MPLFYCEMTFIVLNGAEEENAHRHLFGGG